MSLIDPALAEILVCPACHGELREEVEDSKLVCTNCARSYPVRDGIPIMLLNEDDDDE